MPSQSTLSGDEKAKVKSAIPVSPASNKIFFATCARIYYAYPQPDEWSYAGLQGALAFVKDQSTNTLSFKLVDLDGTRGVIWEHELYEGFEYHADRAFFHSFAGDECMIGFVFSNESEAKSFWKKVLAKKDSKSAKPASEKKKKAAKNGKINKSMISGPTSGSFVHVAHMGYDDEQGFTSKGVDPSWTAFLGQLENSGIDKAVIAREMDFIKDFTRNYQATSAQKQPKKPKPPPPPSRRPHVQNEPTSPVSAPAPPAPPPRAPPRPALQPPAPPSRVSQPPPPPARPAVRANGAVPPPPARPSPSVSAAPPPPPPPPPVRAAVAPPPPPPPPPPPGPSTSGAPPPPPPAPVTASLPAPQPGRSDLLASISGKGIHSLKKTDPNAQPPSRAAPLSPTAEDSPVASGGGDLTSALAEALMARKGKLGDDSDEEDDDDDWD
ncbi:actin regulatory protein [Mycena floridula]|nr:actin regulatory protein [Mycena floridula]